MDSDEVTALQRGMKNVVFSIGDMGQKASNNQYTTGTGWEVI